MELKKGLTNSSSDPGYDVSDGGYLKPEEICADPRDAERINAAIALLQQFQADCEKQIEGFVQ